MDLNQPREIKNELQDFLDNLYYDDNDIYLLGSAGLKSQKYFSDYDLFSPINKIDVDKIIEILYETEEHQNMYLLEIKFQKGDKKVKFKTLEDLQSKYNKIKDITWDFVKLDFDIYNQDKIMELSIIYNTGQQEQEDLFEKLKKDIFQYKKKFQFYKALKREFSLLNYKYKQDKLNKTLEKRLLQLSKFFNSKFGELYTIYSNLGAIKLMIENYDDARSKKMVKLNLQKIGVKEEEIDKVMKELEKLFNTEAKRYLDESLVGLVGNGTIGNGTIGNYTFKKSTRKNKKYDAYKDGKYLVSFGDSRYEQYKDKIGDYSHLDHLDKKRRDNYFKRFGKNAKIESAEWFANRFLW